MEEDPNFDYEYLSKSVGLWFDRLRLARLLKDTELDEKLRTAIIDYANGLIFALQAIPSE